ncbi:hypothetical protein ABL78_3189 [Leptomonas seymouri]|uniref:SAM domain-containing protein n=1 Tax=Leptomonas seymouri TaxID=5684 RepID=A0A0N0P6J6_LEPSE|nr:hypothetical protein ABL78_3189 [Leptomonas seymouri]|eukprot:KPI87716.1 hypothetical protein ABL78_3189 [Leptomonas seymouri]
MPSMTSAQKTTLAAAVTAAVVGVTALTWSVVQLNRSHRASESADVPPESWTKAQVAAWLHDNGVSKAASALCLRFNLTGEALLQVTERDLYRIGVPLRDARVVLAAVEGLKECPVLLAQASQAPTPRQPSLASVSSRQLATAAAPDNAASPGERFEAAWNALACACTLPSDDASMGVQQQRVVVHTSALLECFQALSPQEQATALALVAVSEGKAAVPPIVPAETPVSPPVKTSAAGAGTASATSAIREVEKKLQPLHAMVDGFLEFLQSPELSAVPADDFEELGARVAVQVKRVVRVCEQLPREMGHPLLRKCEKVFEALSRRQDAAVASTTDQLESRKTVMQALYEVITGIKDPAILELPPAQRVKALSALTKKAEAIEALASGAAADAPKDEQVLRVVQPLLRFLREAIQVSAETAATEAGGAVETEKAGADAAAKQQGGENEETEEQQIANADITVILGTIQKIQETLQSVGFQHAPPQVRAQLCAALSQRISALEGRIESLPAPTRGAGQELLQSIKLVLAAVGNAAAACTNGAAGQDAAADEKEEEEAVAENGGVGKTEAEGQAAAHKSPANSVNIERCLTQLEKIFDFLTSDALKDAPANERKMMAEELRQRVDRIRDEIKGDPAEDVIYRELVNPLYDILRKVVTMQPSSQEYLDITEPLRDIQELLNSASFVQLPHAEKMRVAREIVPQLQRLTATVASLPDSERDAAEELVHLVSEELLRIVRERPTTEVTAQSVLDRLQALMRTIQGAKFTTMTAAGRSAWASSTIAELQRLNEDCVALGTEGDALRPIVQRLEQQLRDLFLADSSAEEKTTAKASTATTPTQKSATLAPQKDGRQSIFATVRAMLGELADADENMTPVASTRLQQMLSTLSEAAEMIVMTDVQENLLQDFGEELRKHVERATAIPGSGEGMVDAGTEDEEAADDALDSLRVSLQTLLSLAQGDGGASGPELSSIAAKTEELVSMADEAGVKWREDAQCNSSVRSVLEILRQTGAADGRGSRDAGVSAATAAAPSKVEEVLQSSIKALADAPPTSKEDFTPFMRVLQLAQSAAEQMTNRELVLLKTLQDSVIEAMHRLPEQPNSIGDGNGNNGVTPDQEVQNEQETEDRDDVDAVLDALLDMSCKLRDGTYTSEQLDEFERIQKDLKDLLTRAGIDSTEAMASVREQVRLQRKALHNAQGSDAEDSIDEEESPMRAAAVASEEAERDAQPREEMGVFNEDDDVAANEGVAAAAAVAAPAGSA